MTTTSSRTPSTEHRRRLPKYERAPAHRLPPLQLRSRDGEIIRAVYEMRALTPRMLELLFWPHPALLEHPLAAEEPATRKLNTRAHTRLQQLYHHGYLQRAEQVTTLRRPKPFVYLLDRKGADLLSSDAGEVVDWRPAHNRLTLGFLDHLLLVNAFRVCVTVAAGAHDIELVTWVDDADLKHGQDERHVMLEGPDGGEARKVPILPDGYFHLRGSHHFRCFLEADCGTIVGQSSRWERRDWWTRVRAVNRYVDDGLFQRDFGGKGGMRVLTITKTEGRMRSLLDLTREAGGKSRWWFTCAERLTPASVLGPIWETPKKPGRHDLV